MGSDKNLEPPDQQVIFCLTKSWQIWYGGRTLVMGIYVFFVIISSIRI